MKPLWGAAALVFATGCTGGGGFVRDVGTPYRHEFRQDVTATRYLRSASGSGATGTVLCVFPTGGTPYAEAMESLHAIAVLRANQALENLREDRSFGFYLFYCSTTVTVSADVVEVVPAGAPPAVKPKAPPAPAESSE